MKIARNIGMGLAVASFAVAGAAQAEIRSSAAVPAYTPVAAQAVARGSAQPTSEQELAGPATIILILALAAIIAAVAIAAGGGNDSPG